MQLPVRASRRAYHIIYKTTCLVTDKYYIGMHSTDDLNDGYMGSGQQLRRSIKKHGKEQHKTEILEFLPDRKALGEREAALVNAELLKEALCMNLTTGGTGTADRPVVTKESTSAKLSEKGKAAWAEGRHLGMTGKTQSTKTIAKRVLKLKGQKRTEEQRANLIHGQQQYYSNVDPTILQERGQRILQARITNGTVGIGGRPKGIPMSAEQKARQSALTKGKPLSDHHRQALKIPKLRASCVHCRTETSVGGISRYHATCA